MLERIIGLSRKQLGHVGIVSPDILHKSSRLWSDMITVTKSNEVIANNVVSTIQGGYPRHPIRFAKVGHEMPASGHNRLCVHHNMFSSKVTEKPKM